MVLPWSFCCCIRSVRLRSSAANRSRLSCASLASLSCLQRSRLSSLPQRSNRLCSVLESSALVLDTMSRELLAANQNLSDLGVRIENILHISQESHRALILPNPASISGNTIRLTLPIIFFKFKELIMIVFLLISVTTDGICTVSHCQNVGQPHQSGFDSSCLQLLVLQTSLDPR